MATPVSRGDELELHVDSLAYGGNGVARLNGFVVFVRRGLPGDTVAARVTKVKRGYAEATAEEVVVQGAPRVEAPCRHYPECGGCRFQDLAYEAQIAAKHEQVRDALVRLGRIDDPPLEEILPAVERFHYRNKLEYSFTDTPRGAALGFHRAGRWDEVLEVDQCWLTTDLGERDPRQRARVGAGRGAAGVRPGGADGVPPAPGRPRGTEHRAGARPARHGAGRSSRATTGSSRRCSTPEVRSIHWAVNDRPAEVTNLPTNLLWGEEAIEEEILGLRYRIRPNAFLQTNTAMAERLYELAIEYAGLTGSGDRLRPLLRYRDDRALDGLAGADRLGSRGERGVGRVRDRERRAERGHERGVLRRRGRPFGRGACRARRPTRRGRRRPAAGGLSGKALRALARLEAPKIVYVSCNPTTLAGNVKELAADWGYRLERVRPVDMFPHTPHVESVSLLP
jgi:23S rRNA (uracil1939-C5)-methyltransferase